MIWQYNDALHVRLWCDLAEFFLEWEMFQTEVVEQIETQLFPENREYGACNLHTA